MDEEDEDEDKNHITTSSFALIFSSLCCMYGITLEDKDHNQADFYTHKEISFASYTLHSASRFILFIPHYIFYDSPFAAFSTFCVPFSLWHGSHPVWDTFHNIEIICKETFLLLLRIFFPQSWMYDFFALPLIPFSFSCEGNRWSSKQLIKCLKIFPLHTIILLMQ